MIVRNAALTLQVSQLDTAIDEATRIARDSGGFVFATNFRDPGGNEGRTAVMELRVPSARYAEVLSRLRKLAVRVREETSSA